MHARKTNSASIRIPAVSGVCIYLANNFRRLYVVCHELGMFSMCISYWYPVLFFKYYNTMSGVYLNTLVTAVVPRAYYGFYMYNTWYQVYTKHTLVYTIYYTRIYIVYHGIYHVWSALKLISLYARMKVLRTVLINKIQKGFVVQQKYRMANSLFSSSAVLAVVCRKHTRTAHCFFCCAWVRLLFPLVLTAVVLLLFVCSGTAVSMFLDY